MEGVRRDDVEAVARTVYGEARGSEFKGKLAVAYVIVNRLEAPETWWQQEPGDDVLDDTLEAVAKDPWQFSCWNESNPNLGKLVSVSLSDESFRVCYMAALMAITKHVEDPTGGACYYYADYIDMPDWAKNLKKTEKIGVHNFFKDKG